MRARTVSLCFKCLLMLGLTVGSFCSAPAMAQNSQGKENLGTTSPATVPVPPSSAPAPAKSASKNTVGHSTELQPKAVAYYQALYGVDSFVVRTTSSGQMIRFSYRVMDANKAAKVNDKRATPSLIDEDAGVKLVVPVMDKIGELRQSSKPEVGKTYWMVFSNKGGFVKPGDKVTIEIGKCRVEGLTVQ